MLPFLLFLPKRLQRDGEEDKSGQEKAPSLGTTKRQWNQDKSNHGGCVGGGEEREATSRSILARF